MTENEHPSTKPTPKLDWSATTELRQFGFAYQGFGGRHEVHAGDGQWRQLNYGGAVFVHTFEQSGFYMAAARRPSNGELLALVPVVVREGMTPNVTIESAGDPDDWNAHLLMFPSDAVHVGVPWRVQLDDGPVEEVYAKSGDTHRLTIPDGEHQVQVEDVLGRQSATITKTVEAPYSPDFTLASGENEQDPQGYSTVLTLSKTDAKPVTIDWGDGQTTKVANPAAGHTERHTYSEGRYWVTAKYDDGTGDPRRGLVFIPWNVA